MTFKDLINKTGYDLKTISAKYGIPWRSCYNWYTGLRTPPGYVLTLIYDIYLLERRLKDGKEKDGLDEGMGESREGIQEISEAS